MLARTKRGGEKLFSPADGETIAKDWMMVDLLHIIGAEPADPPRNGEGQRRGRSKRGR
jgi:hypothetical protein